MLLVRREAELLLEISLRADDLGKRYGIHLGGVGYILCQMTVVHFCVTPLRLEAMAKAHDSDILRDVVGFDAHLQLHPRPHLLGHWEPRFARDASDPCGDLFERGNT